MPVMALVVLATGLLADAFPRRRDASARRRCRRWSLLALAMLFANYADAFSSMFYAFEKMEYPAGLTNAVALLKVALGALVLLLGWGYVGLAAVALVVNMIQMLWLYVPAARTLFKPQWKWDWPLQRWMCGSAAR